MYIPTPAPPPSQEAQDLSDLILEMIDRYEEANPELTRQDIKQALTLARAQSGPDTDRVAIGIALGGGVLAMGLAVFFLKSNLGVGPQPIIFIVMAMMILLAIVAIAKKR